MLVVTGGTGMLGLHLLPLLRGREVRVMVQPGDSRSSVVEAYGYEVVEGEITDLESVRCAFRGARQVIHLAGYVNGARGPYEQFARINADGTANVALAAKYAGAEVVMFSSTITVYGSVRGAREGSPLLGKGGYARSKREAEFYLQGLLPERNVILRFPGLFGIGDTGTLLPVVENFRQLGRVVIVGRGDQEWSVLAAHDAARALLLALETPSMWGKVWNVSGGLSTNGELFELIGQYAGVRSVTRLPCGVAQLLAALDELRGGKLLTRDQVMTLAGPLSMISDRFAEATGFEPLVDWRIALRDSVHWALGRLCRHETDVVDLETGILQEHFSLQN